MKNKYLIQEKERLIALVDFYKSQFGEPAQETPEQRKNRQGDIGEYYASNLMNLPVSLRKKNLLDSFEFK